MSRTSCQSCQQALKDFIGTFVPNASDDSDSLTSPDGRWFYDPQVPFYDFNREIAKPGEHPKYAEGAIGIRADDDFWMVALLPYDYCDVSISDLVAVLWPNKSDVRFGPDVSYLEEGVSTTVQETCVSERDAMPPSDLVADILARKEAGRRARAQLPFGEKLDQIDELREVADAFEAIRRVREDSAE